MRSPAPSSASLAVAVLSALPRVRAQGGTWVQTFFDDFNGNALNTSNWSIKNNVTQDAGHAVFVDSAISVSGGNLIITTTQQPYVIGNGTRNFTSGWVDTQNHFYQRGGRWEARAILPSKTATCAWPAWWLLPQPVSSCWPIGTEVDILESVSGFDYQHGNASEPYAIFSTLHYGYQCYTDVSDNKYSQTWPNITDVTAPIIDYSADYHVFGVELNDTSIRWYVDNVTTFVITPPPQGSPNSTWGVSPYTPYTDMFGILNVAVATWGCEQPVPLSGWSEPTRMLVDWVRVWQWVPTCA